MRPANRLQCRPPEASHARHGQRHPRAGHGCGRRRRIPAIRACRWAWPMSRPCCSRGFLNIDPADPRWPDRDRFVLSAGHGSMLLYALLHLTGYDGMTIDELQAFPPARSRTAGPSRIRPYAGRRDDDRPARPRPRQRGRHGAGRATAGRAFRRRARRSPHLCDRRRRLPEEGISHEAIWLAGHSARPADRALGRQPHLDRRPDLAVTSEDQPARFGPPAGGLPVDGHDSKRSRPRSSARATATGRADRLPHSDRKGRPQRRARKRPTARRSARWRSPKPGQASTGPIRRSRFRTTSSGHGEGGERGRIARHNWIERDSRLNAGRVSTSNTLSVGEVPPR